ncbi:ATP-binding protein [Eggerthia catenaformis]|uniref:ATP-binding protein n=1 Tax=Eggerthia catenaformis TaxID=31973 RepID=UPI003C6FAF0F
MRTINLYAHCISCKKLNEEQLKKFNNCESAVYKSNTRIKEEEDLTIFVEKINMKKYDQYEHFYWNFSIPQISKEFDLLRIDNKSILNIELKHYASIEKVKRQLLRNKYYLQFVEKELFLFCYTILDEKLYYLDNDNLIECADFEKLINILDNQECFIERDIERLFTPNQYLISPFNKTSEFIRNEYFLNNQQEDIKSNIMKKVNETNDYSLITLMGSAGSGKSLLIYDIAKEFRVEKRVVIIHCGQLNKGHNRLVNEFSWDIYEIKHYKKINYDKIDVLIIDEGQRIRSTQLEIILEKIKYFKLNCIFSYDPEQVLSNREKNSQSLEMVKNEKTANYTISGKIRSNIEIISFIDNLFNLNHRHPKVNYDNIYIYIDLMIMNHQESIFNIS